MALGVWVRFMDLKCKQPSYQRSGGPRYRGSDLFEYASGLSLWTWEIKEPSREELTLSTERTEGHILLSRSVICRWQDRDSTACMSKSAHLSIVLPSPWAGIAWGNPGYSSVIWNFSLSVDGTWKLVPPSNIVIPPIQIVQVKEGPSFTGQLPPLWVALTY